MTGDQIKSPGCSGDIAAAAAAAPAGGGGGGGGGRSSTVECLLCAPRDKRSCMLLLLKAILWPQDSFV